MRMWPERGILRRTLLAILAVSLVPLAALGLLLLGRLGQAEAAAVRATRGALDATATEALELRAFRIARDVRTFLEQREADVRLLALMPRTAEAYLAFSRTCRGELWFEQDGREVRALFPLYRELAYVSASGQEVVCVSQERTMPPGELRDVGVPANTTFKCEPYFAEARQLAPGEVYVGHVTGFYVSRARFFAGQRFDGVLRFATPVFDAGGQCDGVVVLALDHRHLREFTAHVVPTRQRFAVTPDPAAGSYAFTIDDQAATIAHPNDYLMWGVDPNGQTLEYARCAADLGVLPVRLDKLGFADANLAATHARAMALAVAPRLPGAIGAGAVRYRWAGRDKVAAYAPITYRGGSYRQAAAFGWVGLAAHAATFHGPAAQVSSVLRQHFDILGLQTLLILILSVVVVPVVASLLARQITRPVRQLTAAVSAVERGEFEVPGLGQAGGAPADEIAVLARAFEHMAGRLQETLHGLKQELAQRERTQAALVQARDAAEAATRAKSVFLASMSRELRAPLAAIIDDNERLRWKAQRAGQADLLPVFDRVTRAGRHLLTVVDDVLELSELEAGQVEAHPRTEAVAAVVGTVTDWARVALESQGDRVEVHGADAAGSIHTDTDRLAQCLGHLLNNAITFTHRGQINISVARETWRDGSCWLVFSVADTGVSLPPGPQREAAEPVVELGPAYGGAGLDMAIARRLCRLLGGEITVESGEGRGSVSSLRVPAHLPGRSAPGGSAPDDRGR